MAEQNDRSFLTIANAEGINFSQPPRSMIFYALDREVLRITPEGELVFQNATEAAMALKREWGRLTEMGGG